MVLMDKKIFYTGLVLLLIGIVTVMIGGAAVSNTLSSSKLSTEVVNMTVPVHGFNFTTVQAINQSYFLALAKIAPKANFYLFNSSAFDAFQSYAHSASNSINGLNYSKSLEGKGALYIYSNATSATIPPVNSTNFTKPIYIGMNETSPFAPGTYYLVVDNTNGSASSVTGVYSSILVFLPFTKSSIQGNSVGWGVIAALGIAYVLLIVGIALTIYGWVKKPASESLRVVKEEKPAEGTTEKAYIEQLYKNIGKRQRPKGKTPKRKRTHK